ncbi:MAG: rhomboid family intramembrane serine protease [Phycisphaerae bacterium]|nr:rhomboid family intramembrane serine protease [Phycisphaerae bacterium]
MWKKRWELWIYTLMLVIANMGLVRGSVTTAWYYYPDQVLAGQWYRLLTHGFVHVSWYHLLLDGSAFLMLYAMLRQTSWIKRSLYVLGANIGCIVGVTAVLPHHNSVGYAGLSGIAHGLMAVWALECLVENHDKTIQRIGWVALSVVLTKALFEACDGGVIFSCLHGNLMGHPIGISHLSGILGASLMYGLCQIKISSGILRHNPVQCCVS